MSEIYVAHDHQFVEPYDTKIRKIRKNVKKIGVRTTMSKDVTPCHTYCIQQSIGMCVYVWNTVRLTCVFFFVSFVCQQPNERVGITRNESLHRSEMTSASFSLTSPAAEARNLRPRPVLVRSRCRSKGSGSTTEMLASANHTTRSSSR